MLLVAHRIPATRAACERLAAAGAHVFEADVQVDDRGRVVVSHYLAFGPAFQRDNWRIRPRAQAVRDPLLRDVAELVPASCLLLLDMKGKSGARLTSALRDAIPDTSRFRVCGGTPDDLDTLRGAGFRTWRTIGNGAQLRAVLSGGRLADDAVSVRHTLLTREIVAELHERAPSLVAWTVNSARRARQLVDLGADGITTDRFAVLHEIARSG